MPKVFGMHEIELQPGVEPEDYERFFAEELAPTLKLPGWKTHLLRGDGEHAVESISCSTRSRAWMHVIGTSPDQASSRMSSLGSLNSTQKQRRQWRNGRGIAQSTRKTTLRPITSPSLNSAFYSYPGTRDTAGRPALPASTGGTPHPAPRAGRPHLVEHSNRPLVGLMLPIGPRRQGAASRTSSGMVLESLLCTSDARNGLRLKDGRQQKSGRD